MSTLKGRRLSHYVLAEKIGEGGMGVVWKAEDIVLRRTVAIKILPPGAGRDENRRSMFAEEARLASSRSWHGPRRGAASADPRRAEGRGRRVPIFRSAG